MKKNTRRLLADFLPIPCLVWLLAGLMLYTRELVEAAGNGLDLCLRVVIPTLFPFFVVSSLAVRLGLADRLGRLLAPVMRPVFRLSGPCGAALALGFVGGYPVGARTALSLYQAGLCSRREAERLLAFSNNAGPAFILGVVGAGVFSSTRAGLFLYAVHLASSVLVGFLFRFWGREDEAAPNRPEPKTPEKLAAALPGAVKTSFASCLDLSGFVVFFTVFTRLLFLSGLAGRAASLLAAALHPLGLTEKGAESLFTGLIELTGGVWSLREAAAGLPASLAMAAFMLGWAGLSVHCQVLSFLEDSGLDTRPYLLGKALHGLLSALLMRLLARLVPLPEPVSRVLAAEVKALAGVRAGQALCFSLIAAGLTLALFFLAGHSAKKGGKPGGHGL